MCGEIAATEVDIFVSFRYDFKLVSLGARAVTRRSMVRAGAIATLAAIGIFCVPHTVRAAEAVVIGDSIGQGIAASNGLRNMAQRSFSLRRSNIAKQLSQVPEGAVGIMSLGLNDAADPVWHLVKSVETVVASIARSGRKVVWVGPPCVLKTWDARAAELDIYLRERLATTAIQYVSLRDETICAPALRSRDGQHFTTAGYRYVWDKIRRDSTLAAAASVDACAHLEPRASRRTRTKSDACIRQATAR